MVRPMSLTFQQIKGESDVPSVDSKFQNSLLSHFYNSKVEIATSYHVIP